MSSMPNTTGLLDALPDWLQQRLFRAGHLADNLQAPLYLVGGIIRDLLLGLPNTDVDLVVEGDGVRFAVKLARIYGAAVKRHTRFGTATLTFTDGTKLDVVTARTERYAAPAALPDIEPGLIQEDLRRRDFTINAMAVRLNADDFGDVIDPFDGQHDLGERVIRVLHAQSFVDDPTRMFRAVRLEQRLGFTLEASTERLFREAVTGRMIDRLSGTRLWDQVKLVLEEPDPWTVVARLGELGGLQGIDPGLAASGEVKAAFKAIDRWRGSAEFRKHEHAPEWMMYLFGLMFSNDDGAVHRLIGRLQLNNRCAAGLRHLSAMRRIEQQIIDGLIVSPSDLYHHMHILPAETVLFFGIISRHEIVRQQCRMYYTLLRHMRLSIDGNTLRRMNIPEGPVYRKILSRVFHAKLDGLIITEQEERQKALEIWKSQQHRS